MPRQRDRQRLCAVKTSETLFSAALVGSAAGVQPYCRANVSAAVAGSGWHHFFVIHIHAVFHSRVIGACLVGPRTR